MLARFWPRVPVEQDPSGCWLLVGVDGALLALAYGLVTEGVAFNLRVSGTAQRVVCALAPDIAYDLPRVWLSAGDSLRVCLNLVPELGEGPW
ncbi:MAG: hypothetical protein ACXVYY_01385 [Oryzihumus sp.]